MYEREYGENMARTWGIYSGHIQGNGTRLMGIRIYCRIRSNRLFKSIDSSAFISQ